jgi:hypothetical protein
VGLTPIFAKGVGNNFPYGEIGAHDYTWAFPHVTSFDWTPYTLDVTVPTGEGVTALEVRLHVYSRFTGTIYWDDLTVQVIGTTTEVADRDGKNGLPQTFELAQNYPNPFNPSTKIAFALPRAGNVTVAIYNIVGQKVATLLEDYRPAGRFEVTWDGKDSRGNAVGSGIYFYRLHTGEISLTKRMLFVK